MLVLHSDAIVYVVYEYVPTFYVGHHALNVQAKRVLVVYDDSEQVDGVDQMVDAAQVCDEGAMERSAADDG
jgi:hypothetical protein